MNIQSDAMSMIRTQLCETVERLQSQARKMSAAAIAERLREIERIARDHDMIHLARIARSSVHAVYGPGHRAALECHLQHMEVAIGCTRLDEDATAAIMASIAIRLR